MGLLVSSSVDVPYQGTRIIVINSLRVIVRQCIVFLALLMLLYLLFDVIVYSFLEVEKSIKKEASYNIVVRLYNVWKDHQNVRNFCSLPVIEPPRVNEQFLAVTGLRTTS